MEFSRKLEVGLEMVRVKFTGTREDTQGCSDKIWRSDQIEIRGLEIKRQIELFSFELNE